MASGALAAGLLTRAKSSPTMSEVEVNFLLANMDFEDYVGSVDDDGVYRGFAR